MEGSRSCIFLGSFSRSQLSCRCKIDVGLLKSWWFVSGRRKLSFSTFTVYPSYQKQQPSQQQEELKGLISVRVEEQPSTTHSPAMSPQPPRCNSKYGLEKCLLRGTSQPKWEPLRFKNGATMEPRNSSLARLSWIRRSLHHTQHEIKCVALVPPMSQPLVVHQ